MVNLVDSKWNNLGSGLEIQVVAKHVYLRFHKENDIGISGSGKSQMIASTKGNKNIGVDDIIAGINIYKKI